MIDIPSPAIAIVGRHNSGKTTLIERLIAELVGRGLDVGSIKHHSHRAFDIDHPGKDPYRHRAAGASETVIAAPGQVARIKTIEGEEECADLVRSMPGHDIIVVEGYRKSGLATIEVMRSSFALLDGFIEDINEMTEEGNSLDGIRVKAVFFALYFGADSSAPKDHQTFTDCFVTYEERTHTVKVKDEAGAEAEKEEPYTVAVPITDLNTIYQNISSAMAVTISDEQKANADSVYNLVRYGASTGAGLGSTDAPFIGADGFCSPVGSNWRNIVTSEFGYRKDPFTGKGKGHGGIDLGVPTGTSIRAALPGTVTVSQYSSSYGYYVMIDHGGGLSTLYAHNSKLLVKVDQTVSAGDIVSLSGSTGRSTGPHLHFEVRVNGERTNPRSYLP